MVDVFFCVQIWMVHYHLQLLWSDSEKMPIFFNASGKSIIKLEIFFRYVQEFIAYYVPICIFIE